MSNPSTRACATVPSVLYHGTAVQFSEFADPTLANADRLGCGLRYLGAAVYLTTDPNGLGRYYARMSVMPKSFHLFRQGLDLEADALGDTDGVILSVTLKEGTRLLDIDQADGPLRTLFDSCRADFSNATLAKEFREAVLNAGFDGVACMFEDYPEGWECQATSQTIALYRHELARVVACHDAQQYRLQPGYVDRGEFGLANPAQQQILSADMDSDNPPKG